MKPDVTIGITQNRHYKRAKELYNKFPELNEKILTGIMDWEGNYFSIIAKGKYVNDLWERRNELGIIEMLGAKIKENPWSQK